MAKKSENLVSPDPSSLIATARYKIPTTNWREILTEIEKALPDWGASEVQKGSAILYYFPMTLSENRKMQDLREKNLDKWGQKQKEHLVKLLKKLRKGVPVQFTMLIEQILPDGIILKVDCAPVMYLLITKGMERQFNTQSVAEAGIECVRFIKFTMQGILGGQEITPPTAGLFIKKTDDSEKIEASIKEFEVSFEPLKRILTNAKQEKDKNEKGRLLEKFTRTSISLDENVKIQDVNVNTESEEIDVVLENLGRTPFFAQLQSPWILVECKNWTSKIGAKEIREFAQKIQNRPNFLCKVGLLITTSELTSDASKELIGYRGKDFVIAIAEGKDLDKLIENKIRFSDFLMDKIRSAGFK